MILPIITAVTREVFVQTPRGHIEAALALGATRWEVVKTTVLPFGLSGYISGAMLGLGRALGETIALLIILRGTQTGVRLVAVRRRLHLREQDRRCRFGIQRPVQGGRVHRGRPGAVHPDVRGQLAGPGGGRREGGQVMTADTGPAGQGADVPGRQPAPQGHQQRRDRAGHAVGGDRAGAAGLGAYSVVAKGIGAVTSSTWWFNSQAGMTAFAAGRRRLPRDRRHPAAGLGLRRHLDPDRRVRRHLSGRVRRRHATGQDHHLHGGHPHRCAVDRGGAVHLRAVGRDAGLPAFRASRCRWRWCC